MNILILGAGGHGQWIADILIKMQRQDPAFSIAGYLDDRDDLHGTQRLGFPVLGAIDDHPRVPHDAVIIALGDNCARRRVFQTLPQQERLFTAIHPSAVIGENVNIGPGCVIGANVVLSPCCSIGINAIISTGSTIGHHNRIGAHAFIGPGVHTAGEAVIGEGAMLGIGANVLPQRTIGKWTKVGGGALVNTDLPDYVVAVGVPAKIIKHLPK